MKASNMMILNGEEVVIRIEMMIEMMVMVIMIMIMIEMMMIMMMIEMIVIMIMVMAMMLVIRFDAGLQLYHLIVFTTIFMIVLGSSLQH